MGSHGVSPPQHTHGASEGNITYAQMIQAPQNDGRHGRDTDCKRTRLAAPHQIFTHTLRSTECFRSCVFMTSAYLPPSSAVYCSKLKLGAREECVCRKRLY